MSETGQDKFLESAFWDKVSTQRVYAAFDDEEYNEVFDRALPGDLSGTKIIDVGSASGISAALLAARGAKVMGIDLSPALVDQARELWKDFAERISFKVGDAESLDETEASVDVAFFGGVLHHFPQRENVCNEAFRVIRPGGKFVAIEPNLRDFLECIEWEVARWRGKLTPNEEPIDPYQMQRELEAAGFTQVRFWTTRHDIPVLAQFPILRHFFSRQKGFWIKSPLLAVINALRQPESSGTFFVIEAQHP